MLKLPSSSCRQGILRIPCSSFSDGAANGALEKSPLFRVIRSLRSSTSEKTLFRLTSLFSSESGEGGDDAAKSVDAKAAEEAEYASTGAEAEDAKASSAIVPTIPRPEDHLKVMVVSLPRRPLFPGFYMPVSIKISSIQQNEVYLLGHHCLRKMEMVGVAPVEDKIRESRLRCFGHIKWRPSDDPVRKVEVDEEPLTVKIDPLKELPYNEDDDVIKATYSEVILTLRDVLKASRFWCCFFYGQQVTLPASARRIRFSYLMRTSNRECLSEELKIDGRNRPTLS